MNIESTFQPQPRYNGNEERLHHVYYHRKSLPEGKFRVRFFADALTETNLDGLGRIFQPKRFIIGSVEIHASLPILMRSYYLLVIEGKVYMDRPSLPVRLDLSSPAPDTLELILKMGPWLPWYHREINSDLVLDGSTFFYLDLHGINPCGQAQDALVKLCGVLYRPIV